MKPKFTLSDTMNRFSTEEACKEFLQERRWPNGVKCHRCNNDRVYALKARFPLSFEQAIDVLIKARPKPQKKGRSKKSKKSV